MTSCQYSVLTLGCRQGCDGVRRCRKPALRLSAVKEKDLAHSGSVTDWRLNGFKLPLKESQIGNGSEVRFLRRYSVESADLNCANDARIGRRVGKYKREYVYLVSQRQIKKSIFAVTDIIFQATATGRKYCSCLFIQAWCLTRVWLEQCFVISGRRQIVKAVVSSDGIRAGNGILIATSALSVSHATD